VEINLLKISITIAYGVICILFGFFIRLSTNPNGDFNGLFNGHLGPNGTGNDVAGAISSELTSEQSESVGRVNALVDLVREADATLNELKQFVGRQRTLLEAARERAAYLEDFYRRASVISGSGDPGWTNNEVNEGNGQ